MTAVAGTSGVEHLDRLLRAASAIIGPSSLDKPAVTGRYAADGMLGECQPMSDSAPPAFSTRIASRDSSALRREICDVRLA